MPNHKKKIRIWVDVFPYTGENRKTRLIKEISVLKAMM